MQTLPIATATCARGVSLRATGSCARLNTKPRFRHQTETRPDWPRRAKEKP